MKYLSALLLFLAISLSYADQGQTSANVLPQPSSSNPADEKVFVIDAALWARPRTGENVSAMPPLREAVQTLMNNPGSRLAIHYPGGDDGGLWAQELFDWLVSLGVEPALISMQPGSAFDDRVELKVMKY